MFEFENGTYDEVLDGFIWMGEDNSRKLIDEEVASVILARFNQMSSEATDVLKDLITAVKAGDYIAKDIFLLVPVRCPSSEVKKEIQKLLKSIEFELDGKRYAVLLMERLWVDEEIAYFDVLRKQEHFYSAIKVN